MEESEEGATAIAERQCANARLAYVELSTSLVVRIETGIVAVTETARSGRGSFGWDVQLAPIDATEGSEGIRLNLVEANRVESRLFELTFDAADLQWGLYLLTVRFLADGREFWNANETVSNAEPPATLFIAGPPVEEPRRFFGRSRLIEHVVETLEYSSIVLLGPRRSGKTSVLYRLRETCAEDWTVVLTDLHAYRGTTGDAEIVKGIRDDILHACHISSPPDESPVLFRSLRRTLDSQHVQNVLLLIDELAVLSAYPDVAHQLRAMAKWTAPRMRIVAAGTERDLNQVTQSALQCVGSWPFNEFTNLELEQISQQDAQELLETPVLGYYRYEEGALRSLLTLGAGRPFFLNLLARLTLRHTQTEGGRVIREIHVEAARRDAPLELARWYQEFLRELDDATFAALPDILAAPPDKPASEQLRNLRCPSGPKTAAQRGNVTAYASGTDMIPVTEIADRVDVAVLTIRTDEFEAVLKRFPDRKFVPDGRRYYDYTRISTAIGDDLGVAFVRFPAQGQGMAQAVTRDVIDDLNPTWLFVVGIGGGIPDGEYSLGDVIVATRFEDFSVSAAIQDRLSEYSDAGGPMHPDVESLLAHLPAQIHRLAGWNRQNTVRRRKPNVVVPDDLQASTYYGDDDWRTEVQSSLRTNFPDGRRRRPPKIRAAPIITSDFLVKDTTPLKQWRQVARHAEAVEMEVGGVYLAARHGGTRDYRILAIRGLSDIVGFKRSGDWTAYACHSAAAFCAALIKSGMVRPRGEC